MVVTKTVARAGTEAASHLHPTSDDGNTLPQPIQKSERTSGTASDHNGVCRLRHAPIRPPTENPVTSPVHETHHPRGALIRASEITLDPMQDVTWKTICVGHPCDTDAYAPSQNKNTNKNKHPRLFVAIAEPNDQERRSTPMVGPAPENPGQQL